MCSGFSSFFILRSSFCLLSFFVLRSLFFVPVSAHEPERTRVSLRFFADGAFVLEISNDPNWLLLRLEPFAGASTPTYGDPYRRDRRLAELAPVFIDRVVLFVDGREVRPISAEYIPPAVDSKSPPLGLYRLRGRMPSHARSLRWFYGLVIDPYPMTIRHADGSTSALMIAGEAWSETIDLSGQFRAPTRWGVALVLAIAVAFLAFVWYRWRELQVRRPAKRAVRS